MTTTTLMGASAHPQPADPIEIVLTNPSGMARSGWAKVAIPQDHPMAKRPWVFFEPWYGPSQMAVRTKHQGHLSTIFWVWSVWRPGELEQRGNLVDRYNPLVQLPNTPAKHPAVVPVPPERALMPSLDCTLMGEPEIIRDGAVERVYHVRARAPNGWWWDAWPTYKAFEPTIDVAWRLVWSSRDVPTVDERLIGLKLRSMVPFVVRHAPLNGMQPTASYNQHTGEWEANAGADIGFVDGGGICGWTTLIPGVIDADGDGVPDIPDEDDPLEETRRATMVSGIYGCPARWPSDRYMTAYRPRLRSMEPQDFPEIPSYLGAIHGGVVKDYFAPRPLGLSPNAGSTGAQQAFGAVKGAALVYGYPNWIPVLQYSFMDPVRGTDHRDRDGNRITRDTNPQFYTWSGRLNPRWPGVDNLGKPFDQTYRWGAYTANRPRAGGDAWTGIDDQHRSNSVAVQLLHWTGDDMVEDCMVSQIEADRCMHDGRIGAPRAVGRLLQTWAELLLVMPEEHGIRLVERINEKWGNVSLAKGWDKPVRTLETKTDARMEIVRPTGLFLAEEHLGIVEMVPQEEVEPAWSVWEHGLTVVGMRAMARAWDVLPPRYALSLPGLRVGVALLSNSIVEHGVQGSGLYEILATAYYNDGQPLPEPDETNGWMRNPARGSGVGLWVQPAILLAAAAGNVRAQDIVRSLGLDQIAPRDIAEWRAIVEA